MISREFTPSGSLHTTRLILKTATLPRWAPKGIISRSESWIIEESEVDPHGKVVRCLTRNLEHVKAMQIHETQTFSQLGEGFVDILRFFPTRLKAHFQGKLCRLRKLELFQGLDGASRNKLRTMASHALGRTSSGCVISLNQYSYLRRSSQSREGVALILDLIRQARRQPMTLSSSYLNPTSASRLTTNRTSDQFRSEPHQGPEAGDSPHWD